NYVGVKYGGLVGNVFTTLKIAAIAALVVAGFALGGARGSIVAPFAPTGVGAGAIVGSFGLAMALALFAYDGWNQATFVASEIRDPQRTIPLAMVIAVGVVMAVYLGANAVYLYVLPIGQVAGSMALAADVARVLVGPVGASLIAAAILASTFGTVNAYILATPRVAYAMAEDGVLYRGFASLHPRFLTPDFATLLVAEFSCLLVLTGTYNDLVNIAVFGIWTSYVVTGLALFRFRRTRPDAPRPYRTTGYPVVPFLFVGAGLFVIGNELVNDTKNALLCVGLVILGGVVLLIERAVKKRTKRGGEAADIAAAR
ncbi:MAG: APC family permease, partial [Thermoplasmatota archaeon]